MTGFETIVTIEPFIGQSEEAIPLRDLIYGLHRENSPVFELFAKLDPAIIDELHAIAAHRRTRVADYVAEALMQMALDAADAAWRKAVDVRGNSIGDAQVAQLGDVLRRAMRRHLLAEMAIASDLGDDTITLRHTRVGHSYRPT